MKYIIILLSLFFLYGCSSDGEGTTETIYIDSTSDTNNESGDDTTTTTTTTTETTAATLYALTGVVQDARCLSGGNVIIQELNTDLGQTGGHFAGTTDDDGAYDVPATTEKTHVEVFVEITCYREDTGAIMSEKDISGIIDLSAGEVNNINPLTTIKSPIARALYADPESSTYQNADESLSLAEVLMLIYMGMPSLTESFTAMDITSSGYHNAVSVAVNTALLYQKTEAEQKDFMKRISDDIIAGTTVHQAEFMNSMRSMPLKAIRDNLKIIYAGTEITVPKFWNIIDSDGDGIRNIDDPDSYVELLDRTPIVQYSMNGDLSVGSFDTNDNKFFAFPIMFDDTGSSGHAITNVTGDHISIKANDDSGAYDMPGVEIVSADKIPDNFFDSTLKDSGDNSHSVPSAFSAKMDFNRVSGVKYWLIMSCDDFCRPSMGSPSGTVPFGRNMHKSNIDDDWVGFDQNATFFRGNKIKLILTN